jgi:glycosyltransferase involved in cell wall biosynthesis
MAPLFSIVTPVYNPPIDVLKDTIESVFAQSYTDWEWILVDDRSTDPLVLSTLNEAARADTRVKVIARETNGHIVAASNDGVDAATGTFIALLDHDDLLTPDALKRNAQLISEHDDLDYVYSDEDKVDANGRFYDHFEKPPWSPERLRGQNYCCHFSVLRTDLVRSVGGFREGYDGSQDHDLILRVTEQASRVSNTSLKCSITGGSYPARLLEAWMPSHMQPWPGSRLCRITLIGWALRLKSLQA